MARSSRANEEGGRTFDRGRARGLRSGGRGPRWTPSPRPEKEDVTANDRHRFGDATAVSDGPPWRVEVTSGRHGLTSDETQRGGGADTGPSPFGLWLSGLGSCTAMTLRMYAERKGWPLEAVHVRLSYVSEDVATLGEVRREIRLVGELDEAQRTRLADVAERTPVTRVVKAGVEVRTTLAPP